MSHSDFWSALRSTDHDFIAALRFLDDYARRNHFLGHLNETHHQFVPRFDLEEHEDRYEIYGELPGIRKENLNVEANDDRNIQISGWLTRAASIPAEEAPPEGQSEEQSQSTVSPGQDFVKVQHHDMVRKLLSQQDTSARD